MNVKLVNISLNAKNYAKIIYNLWKIFTHFAAFALMLELEHSGARTEPGRMCSIVVYSMHASIYRNRQFPCLLSFSISVCIFERVNSCHNCKNKEFMTIRMEFSIISISNVILEYLSFLAQKCNLFSKHVFENVAMCIFSSYVTYVLFVVGDLIRQWWNYYILWCFSGCCQ